MPEIGHSHDCKLHDCNMWQMSMQRTCYEQEFVVDTIISVNSVTPFQEINVMIKGWKHTVLDIHVSSARKSVPN